MKKITIPDWLKKILDDSGMEQGKYTFGDGEVSLAGLPDEFVGVAEGEGGGLAVAKKGDGVIYEYAGGEVNVYAIDEDEFRLAVWRDEGWEELAENMPSRRGFGLGIILKTVGDGGKQLTLGVAGDSRNSAMVIKGEMKPEEMLTDALDRELKNGLGITTYEVLDVMDDGGVWESDGTEMPLFVVVVLVEGFDPEEIGDSRVAWVGESSTKVVN